MSPTISLLILPTRTISTISTVSSSVTRMPPTKDGSLPSRFMRAPICGPPPWTMTGLMPTRRSRMTSSANDSFRSAWSMAAPPYLMTTDFPRNSRMYGSASMRISTRLTSLSITGCSARGPGRARSRRAAAGRIRRRSSAPCPASPGRRTRCLPAASPSPCTGAARRCSPCSRSRAWRSLRWPPPPPQDVERDAFRLQQLHVLPYQRVPGLGQDADEILPRQGLELHADRKPALQLGDQVRRLGDVEGAGGDEQHVVGADHPVLGGDRRALDDRQQVALHPFARDVRAVAGALASGHLVELVQEHDARVLDAADGLGDDLLHVDELGGLLLGEDPARLGDADAPALRPRGHHVREHVLEVDAHLLHALAREDLEHRHGLLLGLQLDHALVETPGAQLRAQLLQGGVARGARADLLERGAPERLGARARQQQVEQPILGEPLRLLLHLHHQLGLHHVDAELGQVADHRFDIATHITDFGVLGGFDLDERRLSKLGEPPRDLGFTNAGGADHDDVLRRHLVAQLGRQALAPPPVAQRDGHRALGLALADDVAIELQDDLRGGQPAAHSVSTVIWSFV